MNNLNSARRPPFYLIVFFCEKKKIIINRDLYFFLIHFWSFSSTKESSINRWFNFACENLGEIFVKKFYLIIIDIENKKSICDMHDDVQEKERKCRHSLIKHLHFSKISIIYIYMSIVREREREKERCNSYYHSRFLLFYSTEDVWFLLIKWFISEKLTNTW